MTQTPIWYRQINFHSSSVLSRMFKMLPSRSRKPMISKPALNWPKIRKMCTTLWSAPSTENRTLARATSFLWMALYILARLGYWDTLWQKSSPEGTLFYMLPVVEMPAFSIPDARSRSLCLWQIWSLSCATMTGMEMVVVVWLISWSRQNSLPGTTALGWTKKIMRNWIGCWEKSVARMFCLQASPSCLLMTFAKPFQPSRMELQQIWSRPTCTPYWNLTGQEAHHSHVKICIAMQTIWTHLG